MAKTTHQKELERARARRRAEREAQRRGRRTVVALVVVLVVGAVALGAVLLNQRGGDGDVAAEDDASELTTDGEDSTETAELGTSMDAPAPATAEPCEPPSGDLPTPVDTPYDEQPTVDLEGAERVLATVETTCGTLELELDAVAAPATVGNFVALAEDGYYEGVGFHRVINGFMIQGGDPTGTGSGCLDEGCEERLPGYQFADELALAEEVVDEAGGYPRGSLAMANAGPDTNGSQFFIVQGTPGYPLPPQYAVFGEVVSGMDVVDRIAQGPVDGQLAVDPVVILSVDIRR